MSQGTPPGWYPDPKHPALQRYWNGSAWTEQTQPTYQTAPPAQSTYVDYGAVQPSRRGGGFLKVFLAIIIAGALLLVGCTALVGQGIQDEQNKHAITMQQAKSIDIGTPKSSVIAALGAPESSQSFQDSYTGKSSCIYYNVKDGQFLDSWQFCFEKGLLSSKNKY